jgi:hypothetical protein
VQACGLNAKVRRWPDLVCFYFYFIELSETKMPVSLDLFFGVQEFYFELFMNAAMHAFYGIGA